ncbi:unnamed protein product [Rhizopus stolonifer]
MNLQVKQSITKTIQSLDRELREISLKIHDDPELGNKEFNAYRLLTEYLAKKGFKMTYKAASLETAFMAEFSNDLTGRSVGFCCEYDALPGIGHGCGHNLITVQGLACALSLKALMEQDLIKGTVVLFGTPAEESTSGKASFVNKNIVQNKVDCAMMLHPSAQDGLYIKLLALDSLVVEFFGVPSHAGQAPWNGINAVDALMQSFDNIGMLRQQTLSTNRIHGIIKHGGDSANVIPRYASAHFYARSITKYELIELKAKMENCFRAAAMATGCELKLTWAGPVDDVMTNLPLMNCYQKQMENEGVQFKPKSEEENEVSGSTDMGNFSYAVPSIHPHFGIQVNAMNHTREFTQAVRTEKSHALTLRAAKCLALTAAEAILNDEMYQHVVLDFKKLRGAQK